MALTLVATAGASNANTYATLAEGDTYHEGHLYSSLWDDASDDTKNRALAMATRLLDALIEWTGAAVSQGQALGWPRVGMLSRNGYVLSSATIPEDLKKGTAEFARQLIGGDRSADSDIETQGITSLTAGPVSLAFKDSVEAKVVPDAVWALLPASWGFIRGRSGTMVPLVRG